MFEDSAATTLVLVRHGEAANNRDRHIGGWSALTLTPFGERQAAAIANSLVGTEITAIWTSDLPRARDTAAAIAARTGHTLVLEPGLRERSLGVLDGMSFVDAQARHPTLFARPGVRDHDTTPEGGETLAAVSARVASVLERATAAHPGGRVVLVSHGIALYHAFCHVVGLGTPSAAHQVFTLVGNASRSEFEHRVDPAGRARWRLVRWNDTSHLTGVALDDGLVT